MEDIIPSEIIYNYSFKKAIDEKYICDYEIYLPFIENKEVMISHPPELYHLDQNICKKCLFFINGLLRTGSRRCIVYLKMKEECDIYKYVLEEIMNKYHFCNIIIDKITSDVKKIERNNILDKFQKEEEFEVIKIVLSIRILDEGIDLLKCDSIFLTHLGDIYNDVRNTQRILRANRIDPLNINKKAHIFIWCDDKNIGLNTLQMLRNNDVNFNKKIKINNSNYGSYNKKDIINDKLKNIDDEFIKFININCLTEDEIWEKKKFLLFEYCNINQRCIKENENYKEYQIGNWYESQKLKIINNFKDNKIIYEKLCENIFVKKNIDYIIENNNKYKNTQINGSIFYECKNCLYKTKLFTDMTRHMNRKILCKKNNLEGFKYNEDEIIKLSLIPYINNKQDINIDLYQNKNIITKNKLFEFLSNIDKKKLKVCQLCNKEFNKIIDLKNHFILNCITFDTNKNNLSYCYDNPLKNNLSFTDFFKTTLFPISFDKEWDTSHLDNNEKNLLLFSICKYTKTLECILKNKDNHNILIDKNSSSVVVYNNCIIHKINLDELIDKIIDKIYYHLNIFFQDIENDNLYQINPDLLNTEKISMKLKYDNYKTNTFTKIDVISNIITILDKVKDETLENFNKIKNLNNYGY